MPRPPRSEQTACVIIPAFQEQGAIGPVVRHAREYVAAVVVADDGSRDRTAAEAEAAGAVVLRHDRNRGKGVALNTGFTYAQQRGYHLTLTLDADGQHDPADIPRFVDAYVRTGIPVLVGNRMAYPGNMTLVRRWTNRLMSGYLSRRMGQYLPDTQCGFRLYRTDVIPFVSALSERYAAESEILLRVAARGIRLDSLPIRIVPGHERSMVHPVRDGLRFLWMLWRYNRRPRRRPGPPPPLRPA
jgi:glycosyltransferase involved in cell wall biosynthesis